MGICNSGQGGHTCKTSAALEECPICTEMKPDVKQLKHANSELNVRDHKACASCREQMFNNNQSCPWCRDNVVWRQIFNFLDGLKGNIKKAKNPDQLADLMARWEEYELTRPLTDVLAFTKNMVQDIALCRHLDRAMKKNQAFFRDSAGLWCRFYGMVASGELELDDPAYAERLDRAVKCGLDFFDKKGGGAAEHGGAMYTQIAVAILCAIHSNMSTVHLVPIARRIGMTCVQFWGDPHIHKKVRSRLPKIYAEGISEVVWDGNDIMLQTFFQDL